MPRLTSIAIIGVALAASGCGIQAATPPKAQPEVNVPELTALSSEVPAAIAVKVRAVARNSAERRARELTVRVRNLSCDGVATGSGFAIARDLLVTNRHVLAGAVAVDLNTWDGRTLNTETLKVGVLGDIGIAKVQGRLPLVGHYGPRARPGDAVTVVGYPLGGKLTLSRGNVIDEVDGSHLGIDGGTVLRLTAKVQPGNSGGPVLDGNGHIVAVVYAIEIATGYGLAIPVATVRALAQSGGFEQIQPCAGE